MSPLNTQRNEKALNHLKTLKPYDGWSLDAYTSISGKEMVMLKRRNVPLYKKGFEFIAYDEHDSKCIIGVTSSIGDTENNSFCRGIILVDKNGAVARDHKEIRVSLKKTEVDGMKKEQELNEARQAKKRNLDSARKSRGNGERSSNSSGTDNTNLMPDLTNEQTSELAKLGLMFIGFLTILKIFARLFTVANFIIVPIVILYGMSTCPSNESFDAKKELKRVLRGHHLPENHPDKPKDDWFSSTIARVTASVATELATSMGYELSFFNVFGACNFVTVRVPLANQELYWIGILGKWRYLLKRDLESPEQK